MGGELLERDAPLAEGCDRDEVEAAALSLSGKGPREREDRPDPGDDRESQERHRGDPCPEAEPRRGVVDRDHVISGRQAQSEKGTICETHGEACS